MTSYNDTTLTEKELLRYTRQLPIKGWGPEAQERLKQSKVFVAGTGGLGSPLLFYLAAAGVGSLTLCDYDVVDLTNLNRQILHDTSRVGIEKVLSGRQTLEALNPHIKIEVIPERLTKKNSSDLIGNSDLIADCLDNFEARHLINRVSVKKSIPLIHGGIASFQGQLTLIHPPETPCLACFLPKKDTEKGIPVLGATAGIVGSLQALEALKFLAGFDTTLKNRLLFWDGLAMKFDSMKLSKNPHCKVCGAKGSKS